MYAVILFRYPASHNVYKQKYISTKSNKNQIKNRCSFKDNKKSCTNKDKCTKKTAKNNIKYQISTKATTTTKQKSKKIQKEQKEQKEKTPNV